jgi:glycerol-3-phosphate dehydrogenase (NAD(P)+)
MSKTTPTVAILGAGRLGQAFAGRLARSGFPVVLWHKNPDARESLARPEVAASVGAPPENVSVAGSLHEAAERAEILLVTVTARNFRDLIAELGQSARPDHQLLHATKGVGQGFRLMHEIVRAETCIQHVGALGGPLLASEILTGRPQAVVVGSRFEAVEATARRLLLAGHGDGDSAHTTWVLGSRDLVGVEVAMAMRNVIAVAEGITEALGLGEPARALLAAAGLVEAVKLGKAMGAQPATFVGVAGVGDLVARRLAGYSRNQAVGVAVAQGRTLAQVVGEIGRIPEGVTTAGEAVKAASRLGLRDLPMCRAVSSICDGAPARRVIDDLLATGSIFGRADSFI